MSRRLELQTLLTDVLGSKNVYFQPPASVKMSYPCFVYSLDDINTNYADDLSYMRKKKYKITLVDKDPDSRFVDILLDRTNASFSRFYTADNLNHWVFLLYF